VGEKEKRERESSPTQPKPNQTSLAVIHNIYINSIDIDRVGVMKERDVGSRTKMSAIYVATVVNIFCFLFSKFAAQISAHHSKMYFLTDKIINARIPFPINKLTPR